MGGRAGGEGGCASDEAATAVASAESVEYRDVPGFPGYRVGDDGSVWSCRERYYPTGSGRRGVRYRLGETWARLTPTAGGSAGYLEVMLYRAGRGLHRLVHRLILDAFVGPCPDGMEACHFPDRDPKNNRLGNLRWDTKASNQADRVTHGTDSRGENHGNHRLTAVDVSEILDLRANGYTHTAIAKFKGVDRTTVSRIVRRLSWKHLCKPIETHC